MRVRVAAYMVSLVLLLVFLSCGKKGDPFLPKTDMAARVIDLKGTWRDGNIDLTGRIESGSGPDSAIIGSRVYYAVHPAAHAPCEGCPVQYQGIHAYGSETIRDGRFSCTVPGVGKGNLYYFEVRLQGVEAALGPPSNRARVLVE